jgi:hypothetical protein
MLLCWCVTGGYAKVNENQTGGFNMRLTNDNTVNGRNGIKVDIALTFDMDYAAAANEMVKMLEDAVKTII